jgi:hypothetical protein
MDSGMSGVAPGCLENTDVFTAARVGFSVFVTRISAEITDVFKLSFRL